MILDLRLRWRSEQAGIFTAELRRTVTGANFRASGGVKGSNL